MGHRVSAKVNIGALHDYVAKSIPQGVILVFDGKGYISSASVVIVSCYL